MMTILIPANVMMLYGSMLPIIQWDMLDGWFNLER